jgi:hypothetical protein
MFKIPREQLARLGPRNDADGWGLQAPCGLEFGLELERPEHAEPWLIVHCETADELDHVVMHLPFDGLRLKLLRDGPDSPRGLGWAVKRTDFSENTFTVGEYPLEASAHCVCAEFKRRGHHQDYFVVALAPPPEPPRPWLVKRVDDNGNVFTVEAHLWRRRAEAHVAELSLEPRHKQTYWVERR